jgi:hypothetical protein
MTVMDPGAVTGWGKGDLHSPRSVPKHNVFDASFEIPADMIMSLLSSKDIKWRDSANLFFRTINPSMSIVQPELFSRKVESLAPRPDSIPKDPEMALLLVCMHLITQYTNTSSPLLADGKEMMSLPAYVVAKRVLGMMRGICEPSTPLVQATILIGLYEFGHGDVTRAYITFGDANTMANVLGFRPGKYVYAEKDDPVLPEDEEKRSLYWVLFILDRYGFCFCPIFCSSAHVLSRLIHVETDLMGLPLQVADPSPDDLLPTTNNFWRTDTETFVTTTERHPADVSPSVNLGSFQRISQCAILLTRALRWETASYGNSYPPSVESFSELETATRSLIEAMLLQNSTRWGDYYECFATCTW